MHFKLYATAILICFVYSFPSFGQENKQENSENEENEVVNDTPFEEQFFRMRMNSPSDEFTPYEEQFSLMKKNIFSDEFTPPYASLQKSTALNSNLANIKFMGPYNIGARTRALLIDRSNSNHILAGGTTGGLWKSADQGVSWAPVDDQAINFNVTCITQSIYNTNEIYYGTGEFIGNHTGVYGSGIFKSTDGGNTFTNLASTNNASFTNCMVIKHSLVDPNTVFVGTNNAGLFRTSDGGNTFQNVFNQYTNVTEVECYPDGHVWIAVSQTGIFQSPTGDNGTFTSLLNGLPAAGSGFSRIEMAYCDSFPLNAYILYANNLAGTSSGVMDIYKTTDGGSTWNVTTNPDATFNFLYPKLNLCLTVKPDDPQFVLAGAGNLTYSTDGGVTWALANDVHFDHHSVTFDPNDFSVIYNGCDGGIERYSTATLQTTYQDLNTGYNTQQFFAGAYFPTGNSILAGAQDNWSQIGRNNDSLFIIVHYGVANGCFTQVNQQDPNISYISTNEGLIFKSTNTLAPLPTYTSVLNQLDANADGIVDDPIWTVNPYEINLKDGNQLYFVTQQRIWRSTDGAATWQHLTNGITGADPYAIGISNDTFPTVYIGGTNALFMRVDNAYSATPGNEVDLSSSAPASVTGDFISCIAVSPADKNIVYAAFSTYSSQPRIWKITDANTSNPVWTSISGNLPADLSVTWLEVDPLHPDSAFMAATDFGLYTSADAGLTWVKELSLPNVSIPNIRLRKSDRKLFIFTHGRGAWMAELSSGNTSICDLLKANDVVIFPNPSHDKFNIRLSASDQFDEITVTDISGRVVLRLNTESKVNLNWSVLDLSEQDQGVYFVNIKTNKCEIMKKLVKL
jgi:photosystem II stability/assembly factor-like uncharacterized protein